VEENALEQTLARRIREVAADKGIPISHIADRAGIARSHLFALLRGDRSPTLSLIQRIALVLDVDPLELLRDTSHPT